MSLDIFMTGIIVDDVPRAVEFYRRLGVRIDDADFVTPHSVVAKLPNGYSSFLINDRLANSRWDDNGAVEGANYRMLMEFYLETRAAVDAKYGEMMAYGYQGKRAPFVTSFNMYFALLYDPDGNTVLLSGEV